MAHQNRQASPQSPGQHAGISTPLLHHRSTRLHRGQRTEQLESSAAPTPAFFRQGVDPSASRRAAVKPVGRSALSRLIAMRPRKEPKKPQDAQG